MFKFGDIVTCKEPNLYKITNERSLNMVLSCDYNGLYVANLYNNCYVNRQIFSVSPKSMVIITKKPNRISEKDIEYAKILFQNIKNINDVYFDFIYNDGYEYNIRINDICYCFPMRKVINFILSSPFLQENILSEEQFVNYFNTNQDSVEIITHRSYCK